MENQIKDKPKLLTFLGWLLLVLNVRSLYSLILVPSVFSKAGINAGSVIGPAYIVNVIISAALIIGIIGLIRSKKWGLYLYTLITAYNILSLIFTLIKLSIGYELSKDVIGLGLALFGAGGIWLVAQMAILVYIWRKRSYFA